MNESEQTTRTLNSTWQNRLAVLAGLLIASSAGAQSVVLAPVADTFLSEEYPDSNFGAMEFVNAGTTENLTAHRALYRFDIASAIPAGSAVTSVQLFLEVVGIPNNGYDVPTVGLHRVLRDWGEGDNAASLPRNAAPAGPNEANWTHRFAGTGGTWGIPGGEPGVDYVAVPSALTPVFAEDGYGLGPTVLLTADIQYWLDNPAANYGWMVMVQNEALPFTARRYGSREAQPAFNVPQLFISFQVPEPSSATLTLLGATVLAWRLRRNTS